MQTTPLSSNAAPETLFWANEPFSGLSSDSFRHDGFPGARPEHAEPVRGADPRHGCVIQTPLPAEFRLVSHTFAVSGGFQVAKSFQVTFDDLLPQFGTKNGMRRCESRMQNLCQQRLFSGEALQGAAERLARRGGRDVAREDVDSGLGKALQGAGEAGVAGTPRRRGRNQRLSSAACGGVLDGGAAVARTSR
eukprot:scaffold48_cov311-Pinguiococcus_pyrenoidosus.AAC.82